MTNGAVTGVQRAGGSRMTNGSVGAVDAKGGALSFDVAYAGGTKRVTVPKGTQITTMNPGAIADVKPGAKVTVIAVAGPDGVRQASLINVEPPSK
jgi:predicted phosphodiesterase